MSQKSIMNRRDRAISAAIVRLDQAYRYTVAALELDDQLDSTDRIGELARAADETNAAKHRIIDYHAAARRRRTDLDRAIVEEAAAGGPEAYARQRGLL